jgi:hypothetical protein
MTTSGTATFSYNRDQIIKMAYRKLGVINASETPSAQMIQDGSDALNLWVKALNATGLHIWTETEATLFLQPGQNTYTLGTGSTDHATETYTATTLSAAAASSAVSISVTSATGFATAYNVGVVLDSGSIFWTTQNGAASGISIPLASGLTGAASSGNAVYVYQTNIIRPLRVVSCRRYNFASALDTTMGDMMSRLDYRNMPNKTTSGVPTRAFYDPRGGANTQGTLAIWPQPADATNALKMTWWRPVQDFTSAATTPDLPQEWGLTLVWNLAKEMGPEFDITPNRFAMIEKMASGHLDNVSGWDREPESYLFGQNNDQT